MSDLSPRMEEERRMQMAQMGIDNGNQSHGSKNSGQVTVNTQPYSGQGQYLAAQQPGTTPNLPDITSYFRRLSKRSNECNVC